MTISRKDNCLPKLKTLLLLVCIGVCLAVGISYFVLSKQSSSTNPSNFLEKKHQHQRAGQFRSVPWREYFSYANSSAGILYPNKFPDCLYILQQSVEVATNRTKIQLLQSMNTYWKHAVGFRKVHLRLNLQLLVDVVQVLNEQAPTLEDLKQREGQNQRTTINPLPHAFLLHQRIFRSGGSFPFFANWNPSPNFNLDSCRSAGNKTDPNGLVPVFQSAVPLDCWPEMSYLTVPISPILKHVFGTAKANHRKPITSMATSGPEQQQNHAVAFIVTTDANKMDLEFRSILDQISQSELKHQIIGT